MMKHTYSYYDNQQYFRILHRIVLALMLLALFAPLSLVSITPTPAHAAGSAYVTSKWPCTSYPDCDCSSWANACSLDTALEKKATTIYFLGGDSNTPITWDVTFLGGYDPENPGGARNPKFSPSVTGKSYYEPLVIENAKVTFDGVVGGMVKATNSTITMKGVDDTQSGSMSFTGEGGSLTLKNFINDGTFTNNGGTMTIDNVTFDRGDVNHKDSSLSITNATFKNDSHLSITDGTVTIGSNNGTVLFENGITDYGGAISVDDTTGNTRLSIDHTTFKGNKASQDGGAIYIKGKNPSLKLTHVTFEGNTAEGYGNGGGALYIENFKSAEPLFSDVKFIQNKTTHSSGAGIYAKNSEFRLDSTTVFTGNQAAYLGGAISSDNSHLTINGTRFENNRAGHAGGALYNDASNPFLSGAIFKNNQTTGHGGGIYTINSTPELHNVRFEGNSATGRGGGMFNIGSTVQVSETTFLQNTADRGGGMASEDSELTITTGTTFEKNTAENGGGMYGKNSTMTIEHSTFNENEARGMSTESCTTTLRHVTFSSNTAGGMRSEEFHDTMPATLLLEDVTFTENRGRGLFAVGDSITIKDSLFEKNTAGGMSVAGDRVSISNTTFHSNTLETSGSKGGGLYLEAGDATLRDLTFTKNSAGYGGGMYVYKYQGGNGTMSNVLFSENISTSNGGGGCYIDGGTLALAIEQAQFTRNQGGGLYNKYSTVSLTGVSFKDNVVKDVGGGIFNGGNMTVKDGSFTGNKTTNSSNFGGGCFRNDHLQLGTAHLTLTDVTCTGNQSNRGGGLSNGSSGVVTATNVLFANNTAVVNAATGARSLGGGIYNYGDMLLTNVGVIGNTTGDFGGGIYNAKIITMINGLITGNSASNPHGEGGGVYMKANDTTKLTLNNTTVASNYVVATDGKGGGLAIETNSTKTTTRLNNTIFWGNRAAQDSQYNGLNQNFEVRYSLIEGSGSSINWDTKFGTDKGGNSDEDPLFVNPVAADKAPTDDGDYHLKRGSPAVNAGNNDLVPAGITTDYDDDPRIQHGTVDQGAYESGFAYSIAGTVYAQSGLPLAGATVFTNKGQTTTTAANGTYTIDDLPKGDYTVTAADATVKTFYPEQHEVSVPPNATDVDFRALLGPEGVVITGPTTGTISFAYVFTATVSPADSAEPIAYSWSPKPYKVQGNKATYIWDSAGEKTIHVTVSNPGGEASNSHKIIIGKPSLTLTYAGEPARVQRDTVVNFTATVDPLIATYDYVLFTFGDGQEYRQTKPLAGTGQFVATHTYTNTGNYSATATLIAGVYGGAVVSDTTKVGVNEHVVDTLVMSDLVANPTTLPADNASTATITATVTRNGAIVAGEWVTFTTTLGTWITPNTLAAMTNITTTTTTTTTAKTNAQGAAVVQLRSGTAGVATVTAGVGTPPSSTKSINITFQADKPVDDTPVVEVPIDPDKDTTATLDHGNLKGVTVTVRMRQGTVVTDSNGVVRTTTRLRVTSIASTTIASQPANALGRFFQIELLDAEGKVIEAGKIAPPIEVTIDVKQAPDMANRSLDNIAVVYQKRDKTWADDGIVITERNESLRTLTFTVDHLTLFGLVEAIAQPQTQTTVYLPIIQRSSM